MAAWNSRSAATLTTAQYNSNGSEHSNSANNGDTISLSNYNLAYHHHLQTAIQMGQFYNPEHLSVHQHHHQHSAAALLRTSSATSSSNQSALINAATSSGNNCLGSNSLWDNALVPNSQRGSNVSYNSQTNEIHSVNSGLPCEIWTTAAATVPVVNGRGSGHPQRHKSSTRKPRRRVATMAQRRAANIRERRRMFNLNEAFDKLRRKVPTFAYEKRLSRIETLRLAITYISFMADILTVPDETRGAAKSQSIDRKGTSSNHNRNNNNNLLQNNSQYGLSLGSNRGSSAGAGAGIDCHQNQNVPPISPFAPLGRMYSHHPTSAYIHANIHH